MELAGGPPSRWIVTLVDGAQVEVWADAVSGLSEKTARDEHFVFDVLMDIDVAVQGEFEVTACPVVPGRRVMVAVARFPRSCVRSVVTAGD